MRAEQPPPASAADLASLLSQPTWSVRSLLPPSTSEPSTTVPPKTLHHLLRLSALPPPRTPDEESQMLATLSSQLHFVRAIQSVDTAGIEPLRAIRDETAQGLSEQILGLAELQDTLMLEDMVGQARRPRRRRLSAKSLTHTLDQGEGWDVLAGAKETAGGRYFVVRSGGTDS
ncbi:hypothetical protein EKO27_g9837 [Xylaria grammica]|uniref:Glutamyl-tRNA amidotransferase complex subunit Gta3 domain-containing protein n=1 Tax=Xylaria grammica TaxID=363999 RepID=A0A439CSW6_9PEZI|nr:hypothetical protein EKO27_g9837 [Xylaria grammica]